MRIGIFTETYTPYISGLVTSELMLKNALEKLGRDVYVVTANLESFKYSYDENEKVLRIPGIPTGIYDSRLTGIYPIKAIKKIKSWNLDVIHSQTEFAIGTFARIFAKQHNIPVIHTYHTMYEDYVHYITKGYFTKPGIKLVEYLNKFLTQNKGVGPYGEEAGLQLIEKGDIAQLSFDGNTYAHSLIIIETDIKHDLKNTLIATHTQDAYGRSIGSYNFRKIRFIKIKGARYN